MRKLSAVLCACALWSCSGTVAGLADGSSDEDAGVALTDAGSQLDAGVVEPIDAGTGPIDAVLAAMPPNSWKALPGTRMDAVCPRSTSHYACDMVMEAWGGGAFDSLRDRLIIFGGGHADSFFNNVFAFDLASMAWRRHTDLPAPLDGLADGAPIPAAFYDKSPETCGLYPRANSFNVPPAWLSPSGYVLPDKCDAPTIASQLDDQQPRSTHTYGNVAFSSATGFFYNLGSSALYPSGQATSRRVMAFDFSTGRWLRKADNAGIQIGGTSASDAQGRLYYARNGGLARYEALTDAWESLPSGAATASYYSGAAVDTSRNRLLVTSDGVTLQQWDLAAGGVPRTAITSTGLSAPLRSQLGFEYVRGLDRFVAWTGGRDLAWLDPATNTWVTSTTTGDDPGAFPPNGVYGRIRYSPLRNVLVLARSTTGDVLIYKPPGIAP